MKKTVKKQASLDKITLAIILYFISRLDGILGKTHLQKLLFLTDLLAMKKFKEQITALEYKRYLHGPYSSKVEEYTNHLSGRGYIESKEFPLSMGNSTYTRYYSKKRIPIKEKLLKEMGPDKFVIVDEVVDSFGNISLQNLLDIVYSIPSVKESKMDDSLDMLEVAKKIKPEADAGEDFNDLHL